MEEPESLDIPRKFYKKEGIYCEKGWYFRGTRYEEPEDRETETRALFFGVRICMNRAKEGSWDGKQPCQVIIPSETRKHSVVVWKPEPTLKSTPKACLRGIGYLAESNEVFSYPIMCGKLFDYTKTEDYE